MPTAANSGTPHTNSPSPAGPQATIDSRIVDFDNVRGRLFAGYQLLHELGRGGMGVVFKARQLALDRTVALKVLLPGPVAGRHAQDRFRAEVQAVAQLHHPNIVTIFEAAQHDGVAFFSMEYVPGRTLAEVVAQRPLSPQVAADYTRTIAGAIQYAHERGILHRDLKPSNILIDAAGNPRVTDFGLAKRFAPTGLLGGDAQDLTLSGQLLGSPSYTAPEQAGATGGVLSPATDFYALGAILFHLLTGRAPFLAESLQATLLQVLSTEPVAVRRLNPAVPRDLETICSKCLLKESARRYPSAKALADDLGHFLKREPIRARPVHALEKAWRWCQRRPALALILLLLDLSFAGGVAGILWQWRRADRGESALRQSLYAADVKLAQAALEDKNLGRAARLLQPYIPSVPLHTDLRGFEWRYLWNLSRGDQRSVCPGDGSIVSCVRFSPDGKLLATAGFNGFVTIRDPVSGAVIKRLSGLNAPICRLALSFSPDGHLLAAAAGTNLLVWNTSDWRVTQQLAARAVPLGGGSYELAFNPAGELAAGLKENVHLWEPLNGSHKTLIRQGVDDQRTLLAFTDAGKTLFTYRRDRIRFWDAASGLRKSQSDETMNLPFGLAVSPGEDELAVVDASGKLRLLDASTGLTTAVVQAHDGFAQSVAFSPDGNVLATSGSDQLVRLWQRNTLKCITTLRGHKSEVWAVSFAPDGQTLASAGKDGDVVLWSGRSESVQARRLQGTTVPLWFSADGKVLLTRSFNGSFQFWDTRTAQALRTIPPLKLNVARYAHAVSPDGRLLATSLSDGRVLLLNLETGNLLATHHTDAIPANALAFSPHARQLAWSKGDYVDGSWHGGNSILDLPTGRLESLSSDYAGTRDAAALAFSPDGTLLAGVGPNYTIRLWDLAGKQIRTVCKGHTWDVANLAFSPDGRLLASASNDNTARLWDVLSGKSMGSLIGHKTGVIQVGFSPDGRTLATSANDKTLRLWSVSTRRELLTLRPADLWIHFLFSPTGQVLATGSMSGPVELWPAPDSLSSSLARSVVAGGTNVTVTSATLRKRIS